MASAAQCHPHGSDPVFTVITLSAALRGRISIRIAGSAASPARVRPLRQRACIQPEARDGQAALGEECDETLAFVLHLGFADNLSPASSMHTLVHSNETSIAA
jgi:hypothetical protein